MIQRPEKLFFLFKTVNTLNGVGPRIGDLLKKFLGNRLIDLLFHLPVNIIDRTYTSDINSAESGKLVTLELNIRSHIRPKNKKLPYRVKCYDSTGEIDLVFFKSNSIYLKKILPENKKCIVNGKIEIYNNFKQITHPERIGTIDQIDEIKTIEPVYPLSAGLSQKILIKSIIQITNNIPDLPEWHRKEIINEYSWISWKNSIKKSHNPKSFVNKMLELVGFIEVSENTKSLLIKLAEEDGKLSFSTNKDNEASRNRIMRMLRIIISSMEFQFS